MCWRTWVGLMVEVMVVCVGERELSEVMVVVLVEVGVVAEVVAVEVGVE